MIPMAKKMTWQLAMAAILLSLIVTAIEVKAQTNNIDNFLRSKMKYLEIPGLQVAVIQKGKLVKLGAYGLADIEYAVPATNKTLFSINSATKCFTGVAIMQLVEAGKINLEDPVSKYLDSLPASWKEVRLRQLLSHTSGIPDVVDRATEKLLVEGDDSATWEKVKTLPMEFLPGQKSSYNQSNYILLGLIINKISGQPFTVFFDQKQFQVAGMPLTCFGDTYDVIRGKAYPYTFFSNKAGVWKRTRTLRHVFEEFPPLIRTASGINATAEELAHWLIALHNGQLLKKKESLATMWAPQQLNDGSLIRHTIGWSVTERKEHRAVTGIGGARSAIYVYPDDDLAVVILTNLQGANPESFIDQVAGHYIPSMHPFTGFGLPAQVKALHIELRKRGFEKINEVFDETKRKDSTFKLSEYAVNEWGYILLQTGKTKEAIEVLKLNTRLYPEGANTFDSLAEAYEAAGNKALAIQNYRRSLVLNPANKNASDHLLKLGQP
jgi:CubicO group peptidase (beta-lactamase class C family)